MIEFADAEIFFEFNASDLDLDLQLFFDAEGWRSVAVEENLTDPATSVIEWADASAADDPAIVRYQVAVAFEEGEPKRVFEFVADVLATTRSVTVPPEFFAHLAGLEGEYKAGVLAIEASSNRTISEQEFAVSEIEE